MHGGLCLHTTYKKLPEKFDQFHFYVPLPLPRSDVNEETLVSNRSLLSMVIPLR